MLTAVKNQIKVSVLSIKFNLIKEMSNRATFISNIIFMILNNAAFLVEWFVLFSIKSNIASLSLQDVMLLWGIASGSYGVSRFFFCGAFSISKTITNGKLDALLVQPKNVLIQIITSKISPSALGDLLYAYIIYFICGFNLLSFLLYTYLMIIGGLGIVALGVIYGSLSFFITNSEDVTDFMNNEIVTFGTYPDHIFKGLVRVLLYTAIPVGIVTYMPHLLMLKFDLQLFLIFNGITLLLILLAFSIFNKGLTRYTSSNLMIARI